MGTGVLNIAHKGVATDKLTEMVKAPSHLSSPARKIYAIVGKALVKSDRLRETNLQTLEIFAEAYAQWIWACKSIEQKNKAKLGSGYMQTYKTGATNITTELVIRNDAADTMLKCSKQFGLDPKSEKELKDELDKGQMKFDFFDEFLKLKSNG